MMKPPQERKAEGTAGRRASGPLAARCSYGRLPVRGIRSHDNGVVIAWGSAAADSSTGARWPPAASCTDALPHVARWHEICCGMAMEPGRNSE